MFRSSKHLISAKFSLFFTFSLKNVSFSRKSHYFLRIKCGISRASSRTQWWILPQGNMDRICNTDNFSPFLCNLQTKRSIFYCIYWILFVMEMLGHPSLGDKIIISITVMNLQCCLTMKIECEFIFLWSAFSINFLSLCRDVLYKICSHFVSIKFLSVKSCNLAEVHT